MESKIFKLNSPDRKWYAEVSADYGANVTKLQYEGEDVFIPLKSKAQLCENPFTVGSPLLFPANRTAGGRFVFNDREYHLTITDKKNKLNLHGLLYCREFSVSKYEDKSITLQYENTGEIYPFPFIITARYTLFNCGLEQKFTLKNTGETDMPYTFALHTTFCEPENFCVPIFLAQEKDSKHIPTGRYLPLDQQELEYVSGFKPHGIPISGYYKANGNAAVVGDYLYSVCDGFDHFVLYNGGGKSGYLCVEPQVGAVNGLNIPGGCRILSGGEKDTLCVSVERLSN